MRRPILRRKFKSSPLRVGQSARPSATFSSPQWNQRRIVTYLEGIRASIETVKQMQAETAAELGALLPSVLDKAFSGAL